VAIADRYATEQTTDAAVLTVFDIFLTERDRSRRRSSRIRPGARPVVE